MKFSVELQKYSVMRKRFEKQTSLGQLLIQDTVIPLAKLGGRLPALCAALKEIFITPHWNV